MSNGARGPGSVGKSAGTIAVARSSIGDRLKTLQRGESEETINWPAEPIRVSVSLGLLGAVRRTIQRDENCQSVLSTHPVPEAL